MKANTIKYIFVGHKCFAAYSLTLLYQWHVGNMTLKVSILMWKIDGEVLEDEEDIQAWHAWDDGGGKETDDKGSSLNDTGCWLEQGNSRLQLCISGMLFDTVQHTVFQNARFKVFTALLMTITIFCNMTPCTLV